MLPTQLYKVDMIKGVRARLLVDPEMKPRFFKSPSISYALKEKISRELDRLVKAGILKPITANQAHKVDQYPLHKAEDIFAALAGGEKFSKIDLRDAYNQLELDDESQLYTVINTHQDDILITGKNDQDHLKNLECVLQRIQEAGLKLRKDICSFLAPSLEYLGHKIAKEGLQPLPSKVEAIQAAPSPTNLTELRAFLAEKKYSQLEREALGIVFGVTRFLNYLLGNSFTLRTDHKQLPTSHVPEQNSKEHDSEPVEMVLLMDALDSSPVTSDDILVSLPGDPALRQALDHTLQGCKEETLKEMELMPYWSHRYELRACEGLLFWGNRVIIPTNLRAKMLDELHNSHQSIPCQHATRTTPVNWPSTNQPWDRDHIDHLGPFKQNLYLIVVDACTKWIEAIPVPNTSTRETIEQLHCLFSRQFITRNGLNKVQQGSISQRLAEILLGYRRTPIASIGKSPSKMMFGRNIWSRLDLILPNPGDSGEPGFKVGESV
ncbi:K02A2.6-like [Cordylochernes scorpioides]|uniref:K02A2.6-like n=1 Tax=Cordylochernes scorpioides TaxID=51811 RepID=A0ABY6LL56_9ARAC|nr:K02A2.6-like [Cordylochernes scorpioides]